MNFKSVWEVVRKSVSAWIDDYAPSMGAALSYYTLFSIAPLLIIVIAVAGFVFGREAVQGEIAAQLSGLIGTEGAEAVQGLVASASAPKQGIVATVISAVLLILGATTVFGELQSALDRIWRVPSAPKASGIWHLLRTRLLSFGLVLGLGFLLLVSLVVSAGLAAFGTWWGSAFEGWEPLLQLVTFATSFFLVTGLFAMIYKIMPRPRIAWRDVWIGAAVTALLFEIGKLLIGLYLGKAGVTSGFGAAGSVVVLLVWVYYSAQIFLLGAEFTWVYAHRHGSKADAPALAAAPLVPSRSGEADTPVNVEGDTATRAYEISRDGIAVSPPAANELGGSSRPIEYMKNHPIAVLGVIATAGLVAGTLLRGTIDAYRARSRARWWRWFA